MKICSDCGAKNFNSAKECDQCAGRLIEPEPTPQPTPDAEYQKKVIRALERLAEIESSPRKVDVSLFNMSISDMAVMHFRLFVSALPLASTLILFAFGVYYLTT